MGKYALICGVSEQDGADLAKLLLDRGYRVIGTARDAQISGLTNLTRLGIRDRVELASIALNDFRSVSDLGWRAVTRMDGVVKAMVQAAIEKRDAD